jgi:DNA or RNA helicases of superfamily II
MKYELRDNQKAAVKACEEFLLQDKPKPAVVVAPTGYGKSILIGAVANLCETSVIVLQPSVELLKQNLEKYESYGNFASVYSASAGQKEIGHVTFATIGSVKDLGKTFQERGVKVLLVDECHASYPPEEGSMFRKFIDDLKPTHIIGFTATPFRLKTYGDLRNNWTQLNMLTSGRPTVFKDIIHVTQIQELVRDKFWAKLNYEMWDFDTSSLRLNSTGAEYTEQSVQRAIIEQGVNENVFKRCKKLIEEGKNALVFMDSVENAKILAESLGEKAACVDGMTKKKDRAKIVEDFKNNKIQILTNQSVMVVGFDKPDLQTVIMARPTNSLALLYQIFGRGVRNPEYPNLKECLIIDFCNNVKRFGKIEDLRVVNKEGYGWGVFNNTHLLTGTPMGAEMTIEQLDEVIELEKENLNDFKLTFGAHKGKRLSEVPESYRVWLVKNLDGFNSLTASQKTAIAAQCMKLQGKAAEVAYDPRSIILFDLNNISYVLHKGNKLSMDGLMEYVSSWFPSCNTSNFKIVSDSKKSTYWRKKLYPDYKENRKPSADERFNKLLYELKLTLQGQPFYVCQEVLEADDIVATYARNAAYDRVTCVSADSDFHQLTFYSRFVQISPLKKEVEVVSKREAIGTLVGKVLKGDPKDNIKKSHTQIKIKTEDLTIVKDRVYANLVDYVKRYPHIGAQDLPLRRIVWEELNVMFAMDRGMFDLNFTLINLIQREYSEVINLLIS